MTNYGVVYDVGEVTDKKAQDMVDRLEKKGIISKLEMEDKGHFSPVVFLGKLGGGGVQKVMDFCLLESYSKAWKTHFLRTLAIVT